MKSDDIDYERYFQSDEVQRIAKVICEIARECWDLGLSDSTGFSISQVIPGTDLVLVDKSGTGFRRNKITPDDLLLIDLDGNLVYQPNADNPRVAPVNVAIHLAGYKKSAARGCIHWHDPYTNAFAAQGMTIHPFTLQSKLIGDVPCVMVDDRKAKQAYEKDKEEGSGRLIVPDGLHCRSDVYAVMSQVGDEIGAVLEKRNSEFARHGVVITHFEHGLFAFGRHVEEAFENAYRSVRNAQAIIASQSLKNYPDDQAMRNAGTGDTTMVFG
jgi:ribulose-5-phosphate 4-epimerase/fuculose-1-phosphate aldolase